MISKGVVDCILGLKVYFFFNQRCIKSYLLVFKLLCLLEYTVVTIEGVHMWHLIINILCKSCILTFRDTVNFNMISLVNIKNKK